MNYKMAVVIGRFQLFHNSHVDLIKFACQHGNEICIIIGSSFKARDVKNPFTFQERVEMILGSDSFTVEEKNRMQFYGVRDTWYNEDTWLQAIQQAVPHNNKDVCIIGHKKDQTSYYLESFPQWTKKLLPAKQVSKLNATTMRNCLFETASIEPLEQSIPTGTKKFLTKFLKTETFENLKEEYLIHKRNHLAWKDTPFKPIFHTTDAVVTCRGHVLMVKRKFNPGKGLLALPGGFVDPTQTLIDSLIRELKEETNIDLKPSILKGNLKDLRPFDYPERSLRGRTITYAGLIPLSFPTLPHVKGGDDASHALWVSYSDVRKYEEQIFEDHLEIIQSFINI